MEIKLSYKYGIQPAKKGLELLPVPIIRELMELLWFMISLLSLPSKISLIFGPDRYYQSYKRSKNTDRKMW